MVNITSDIDEKTGLTKIHVGNWIGLALEFKRNNLSLLIHEKELKFSGVYLLIGIGKKSSVFKTYIGETDVFLDRIKQHHSSKKFWDRAIFFTTRDNSFDKGNTLYLEYLLYDELRNKQFVEIENISKPNEKSMKSHRRKEMKEFLSKMLLILKNKGYFEYFVTEEPKDVMMEKKRIYIKLEPSQTADKPSWKKYTLIPVLQRDRHFFPKYKESFVLETDIGPVETHVTSISRKEDLQNLEKAGKYIRKGMGKWFRFHNDLQVGDLLIIEEIEPKKRYKLKVKKG